MVRYARSLAEQQGIECPPEVITNFTACRAFLDEHSPKAQHSQEKNWTVTPKGRRLAARAGNSNGGPKRVSASVKRPTEAQAKTPRQQSRSRTVASGKDE
jgi:DNA topoisomerase-3